MTARHRRALSIVAGLVIAFGLAAPGMAGPFRKDATDPQAAQSRFVSNHRPVRVDVFRAAGAGKHPAVLLLHGASGLGKGELIFPQAKALAERGITAFVVHYFDGLGPSARRPASVTFATQRDRVIEDAIGYVASRPDVDNRRIGLFGLSLGGYHAVGLAGRDRRVAAVVSLVGAFPGHVQKDGVHNLPPILILAGAADRVVPLERTFDMALLFDELGAPYEMKVYAKQGHAFSGAARENSVVVATEFFERHLATANRPAS